jgi:integrase
VADLILFLFGTGARIREALHCTAWADVDLEARAVRIRGTKTDAADRTVALSDDLADVLTERARVYGTKGLVFGVTRYPSKLGQERDVNNVLRVLRRVLADAGMPWAGSHTFRRTVATWMDEQGAPLAEIAAQLGHANTSVTHRYLARKAAPTRAASIMRLPKPADPKLALVSGE